MRTTDGRPYKRDMTARCGYRPNKDLDVALHNKKETRGSLLSACFYIAIELNFRL